MKLKIQQHRDGAALLRTFANQDDMASHYAAEFGDADRAAELLDRRNQFYLLADFHTAQAEAAELAAVETAPAREIAGLSDGRTHFYDDGLHGTTPGDDAIISG